MKIEDAAKIELTAYMKDPGFLKVLRCVGPSGVCRRRQFRAWDGDRWEPAAYYVRIGDRAGSLQKQENRTVSLCFAVYFISSFIPFENFSNAACAFMVCYNREKAAVGGRCIDEATAMAAVLMYCIGYEMEKIAVARIAAKQNPTMRMATPEEWLLYHIDIFREDGSQRRAFQLERTQKYYDLMMYREKPGEKAFNDIRIKLDENRRQSNRFLEQSRGAVLKQGIYRRCGERKIRIYPGNDFVHIKELGLKDE